MSDGGKSIPRGSIPVTWRLLPGLETRETIELDDVARIKRSVIVFPGLGSFKASLIDRIGDRLEVRCWRVKDG